VSSSSSLPRDSNNGGATIKLQTGEGFGKSRKIFFKVSNIRNNILKSQDFFGLILRVREIFGRLASYWVEKRGKMTGMMGPWPWPRVTG
jgi:hypothetical protein